DASRPATAWARRNAELSGLGEAPIRWLVDDARAFVRRERRRGRHYDEVVLDPPSYGHGDGAWRLDEDLPALVEDLAAIVGPRPHRPCATGGRGMRPASRWSTASASCRGRWTVGHASTRCSWPTHPSRTMSGRWSNGRERRARG